MYLSVIEELGLLASALTWTYASVRVPFKTSREDAAEYKFMNSFPTGALSHDHHWQQWSLPLWDGLVWSFSNIRFTINTARLMEESAEGTWAGVPWNTYVKHVETGHLQIWAETVIGVNKHKSLIFVQIGWIHGIEIIVFQFLGRIRNDALTDIEWAAGKVLKLTWTICPSRLTQSRVRFVPVSHYSWWKACKIVIFTKAFDKQHCRLPYRIRNWCWLFCLAIHSRINGNNWTSSVTWIDVLILWHSMLILIG